MESVESAPSNPFTSTPKKPANPCPPMVDTPEKSMRPPRVRNQNPFPSIGDAERSVELPEKYSILCELFNVIVSVIPLLRMRKKSPTFANICPKIEALTHRRFTVNHLAQLKYIMPEAVLVKRIRVRDEQTDCMKEELLITLDREAVKDSNNMRDIGVIFRGRVEDYYETHIEGSDIPAGELPALFGQLNQNEGLSIDKSSCVASASHVPQLFKGSFSCRVPSEKLEKQTIHARLGKSRLSESSTASNVLATPIKDSSAGAKDGSFADELSKEISSLVMKDDSAGVVDILQGTPAKEALTPVRLTETVPAIKPSKRCHVSSGDDTCDMPTKLARLPNRRGVRSLMFEASEDSAVAEVQADDDSLPESLLHSVRENERKILEEQDPAISQERRRHQLMSGVPKLFDMIHLLFHSSNRPFMTKEELMYKLISSHCEIVDRGELEEQFKLLQELAPECISERLCSSGDALVRLNRSASVESVHAKLQLQEA